jgi:hypothetical protein
LKEEEGKHFLGKFENEYFFEEELKIGKKWKNQKMSEKSPAAGSCQFYDNLAGKLRRLPPIHRD